ncbi:MAG TPA: acryloyl-CoA reductase [Acidimicrobiales bacterium]
MTPTPPPSGPGASDPQASDPGGAAPGGPFAAFVVSGTDDGVTAGVSTLTLDDLPPGEVLIEVAWSAVNYKDGMVTRPGNRVARTSPLVPGVDLVGAVAASDDPAFAPGELVIAHGYDLGVARHGGFARFARVPAAWVVRLPEGLTPRRAAVLGTAGFTAALSLHRLEHHGLRPGTGPVLVTGASGGVGGMAVALAAAKGYEVVASTGRTAERDYLVDLGAAEVIGRDDLIVAPERTLGPERWAGAIDCVGGATLSAVLRSLRYGAAVAASGLTGGSTFESSVYPFIVRNAALLGIDTVLTPIEERRRVWAELAGWVPGEAVDALVDGEVDLSGLAPVLDDILAGRVRGRMLVRPQG